MKQYKQIPKMILDMKPGSTHRGFITPADATYTYAAAAAAEAYAYVTNFYITYAVAAAMAAYTYNKEAYTFLFQKLVLNDLRIQEMKEQINKELTKVFNFTADKAYGGNL